MTKRKAKGISLLLGVGIIMATIPAIPLEAAPGDFATENTKRQIISMSDRIDAQLIRINDLSDMIVETRTEIERNQEEIQALSNSISEAEAGTELTRRELEEKTEAYGQRLREVYKNGNTSVIKTLLGADNIADLFMRYKVARNIAKHDKALLESLTALKATLEEKAQALQGERDSLQLATEELKDSEDVLDAQKAEQQIALSEMKAEKALLRQLLKTQEVALFDEIQRILNDEESTEEEVSDALTILATIQAQVSTAEALERGKALAEEGKALLAELKEAKREAKRLAKEKAAAEKKAKELEAKRIEAERKRQEAEALKLAAEEEKAEALAAQKEADYLAALEKTKELEAEKEANEAAVSEFKAEDSQAKEAAEKAKALTPKLDYASTSTNMTFNLTFYTDLPEENGGWTITATGEELVYGVVANNVFRFYTKIYLEGYGTMTVKDRGGSNFNTRNRLDVFIPRNPGESNSQYFKRVNNLGRRTVQGRVLG